MLKHQHDLKKKEETMVKFNYQKIEVRCKFVEMFYHFGNKQIYAVYQLKWK